MNDFLIIFCTGLLTFFGGILLLKRETSLFKFTINTEATVVEYYKYRSTGGRSCAMYTMAIEYKLSDGTTIRASEQSGSSRRKYPIGTKIEIGYSQEKPEMFNVKGDHSRKIIMIGMIVVGLAICVLSILYALGFLGQQ